MSTPTSVLRYLPFVYRALLGHVCIEWEKERRDVTGLRRKRSELLLDQDVTRDRRWSPAHSNHSPTIANKSTKPRKNILRHAPQVDGGQRARYKITTDFGKRLCPSHLEDKESTVVEREKTRLPIHRIYRPQDNRYGRKISWQGLPLSHLVQRLFDGAPAPRKYGFYFAVGVPHTAGIHLNC